MEIKFHSPFATITQAYIVKSNGQENGQMFVEGVASTTDLDQTVEKMSPEAIAKMAARLVGKPLRSEHSNNWDDDLGKIVKADVITIDGKPALWIKARLNDWLTKAKDLYNHLMNGAKVGMSVAGQILPGGLVKELDEHIGKFVPVYKDIEPTEVSITSHPANLATFALAVAKSIQVDALPPSEDYSVTVTKNSDGAPGDLCKHALCEHAKCMQKGCFNLCAKCMDAGAAQDASTEDEISKAKKEVTNAHDTKPKEYADVPTDKFLDDENYKYPADKEHIKAAHQYFNHAGQREAGGYSTEEWADMGGKLAKLLGKGYKYDASSEKVVETDEKGEAKKSIEEGGDNDMHNQALASGKYSPDVLNFIKAWNGKLPEDAVQKSQQQSASADSANAQAGAQQTVQKGSSSSDTSTGSSDTSTGSSDTSSGDSLSSLLSSVLTTLSDLKSSVSGSSASSSDTSTDDSTSTDSDKTSTDKAASTSDSTSTGSSSDSDFSFDEASKALTDALAKFSEAVEKAKKPADGSKKPAPVVEPSSASTQTSTVTSTAKAADAKTEAMAKSIDKLTDLMKALGEKIDSMPQVRKGVAISKQFTQEEIAEQQKVQKSKSDMEAKLLADKTVTFKELHAFRTYGLVPERFNEAK